MMTPAAIRFLLSGAITGLSFLEWETFFFGLELRQSSIFRQA